VSVKKGYRKTNEVVLGRFPVRFSGLAPRLAHPPKTSADTAAVLRELGMDDKEIAALREGGIIG
jgi:crotonobetainyl-CoA:carnitine CoA-transferase CaiB-like acyl-CoA transferase